MPAFAGMTIFRSNSQLLHNLLSPEFGRPARVVNGRRFPSGKRQGRTRRISSSVGGQFCKKRTGEISRIVRDLQWSIEGKIHGEAILKQAGENVG